MLAIAGGKGGCGKTTATLGLARALATAGRDPLVVDADTDLPDLHLLADVDREPTATALAGGDPLECVSQRSGAYPGVRVVTAGRPAATADALYRAADWHGPVLVDCPAGAGPDAVTPLRHSDRAILVTTDERETLRDATKTAAVAEEVEAPAVGTLLRGDRVTLPFQSPHVEQVPEIISAGRARSPDAVLDHPQFRAGCAALARPVFET